MICHHYRCLFVHIPKTAGQSVEHAFLGLLGLRWETRIPLLLMQNRQPEIGPPSLAHLKAREYVLYKYLTPEMFDSYFKFSFVRNPWSRMVSIYKYMGFDKKSDFKTFLMCDFKNDIFKNKYWFVGPQVEFLSNGKGDIILDYVGRYETLQADFSHVCRKIGIPEVQLPYVNVSGYKKSASSLKKPKKTIKNILSKIRTNVIPSYETYHEYYDQETIDYVADIYRKDIDWFGYEFE